MITKRISIHTDAVIPIAVEVLRNNGVIAFPTDTVFGLGANVWNAEAIRKLFRIKGRDFNKAIAVLIGSFDQMQEIVASYPPLAKNLADRFWPGALTILMKRAPKLPNILSPNDTIGIRMPALQFTRELLLAAGPLATTSANRSGKSNCLEANQVMEQLSGKFELLLEGLTCPGGIPSTVVDCQDEVPRILRIGAISEKQLLDAISKKGN